MKKFLLLILSVSMLSILTTKNNINALEYEASKSNISINDITQDDNFKDYLSSLFNKKYSENLNKADLESTTVFNPSGQVLKNKISKLTNIDGIHHFENITYININKSNLATISEDLFKLANLQNISLNNFHTLSADIPDKFDQLTNLKTFGFNFSGTAENPVFLPDSFFNSKSLINVNLSNAHITGNIKIPNPANIRFFNNYGTDATYVPENILLLDPNRSNIEINSSKNKITRVSVEEYEHLEKLRINNKDNIRFYEQFVTYSPLTIKAGESKVLTNDTIFTTINKLNKDSQDKIDISLTITDKTNTVDYVINKEFYSSFITSEGVVIPENLFNIVNIPFDSKNTYHLEVKINNTVFEGSNYIFPFNINDDISKTIKFVDISSRLSIADDLLVSGKYGETITLTLPNIENYKLVRPSDILSIELLDTNDVIVKYSLIDDETSFPGTTPDPEVPEDEDNDLDRDLDYEDKNTDDIIKDDSDKDIVEDENKIIIEKSGNKDSFNKTPNTASGQVIAPYLITIIISLVAFLLSRRSLKKLN